MSSFWVKLDKPFFALAPMADVTDQAFRQLIAKYSKPEGPDIFWTEFVSADGLATKEGREKLLIDFRYCQAERPILAQIFGSDPENMRKAAQLVSELDFDGIDINMGCPDRKIEKQGAGAGMIKNPELAKEVIEATIQGAKGLPVSVKTRIGYNKDELQQWVPILLNTDIAALTMHFRTRKDMSDVPAKWHLAPEIVKLRDEINPNVLLIGNGDLTDIEDARQKTLEAGFDGAMLGRAIFGNPWLFSKHNPDVKENLKVLIEHTKLFEDLLGEHKSFSIMKKHFKAYVNGFNGAKEFRAELMRAENAKEVEEKITDFIEKNL